MTGADKCHMVDTTDSSPEERLRSQKHKLQSRPAMSVSNLSACVDNAAIGNVLCTYNMHLINVPVLATDLAVSHPEATCLKREVLVRAMLISHTVCSNTKVKKSELQRAQLTAADCSLGGYGRALHLSSLVQTSLPRYSRSADATIVAKPIPKLYQALKKHLRMARLRWTCCRETRKIKAQGST